MGQYLYNLGVVFSQTLSVLLGGHPDDSISERTARAYLSYKDSGKWQEMFFICLIKIIDTIIFFEPNHTMSSLSDERNAKQIWNWENKDKGI